MYFRKFITKASLIAVLVGTMGFFSAHAMNDEAAKETEAPHTSLRALNVTDDAGNNEAFLKLKAELEQTKTEYLNLRIHVENTEYRAKCDMEGKLRDQEWHAKLDADKQKRNARRYGPNNRR